MSKAVYLDHKNALEDFNERETKFVRAVIAQRATNHQQRKFGKESETWCSLPNAMHKCPTCRTGS